MSASGLVSSHASGNVYLSYGSTVTALHRELHVTRRQHPDHPT